MDPFGAGPYSWVEPALSAAGYRVLRHHAWLCVLVCWLPLAVLSAFEGLAISGRPRESFLLDFAAYARYLVAPVLYFYASAVSLPQLADIVRYFRESGVIGQPDIERFESLINSTRALATSRWVDAGLLALAYSVTLGRSSALYPADVSSWVVPASVDPRQLSLAGWWRMLVSQPLFLALTGVWLWRLLLWMRFVWTIARLDLQLVAGHPDRLGGLRVVTTSLKGFSILAFACGVVAAGSVAEEVIFGGRSLAEFQLLIGAQVLGVLVVLAGPLLLLMQPVLHVHQRGMVEYGRLASQVGREFESRWTSGPAADQKALGVQDFSAMTDLNSIVANAQAINLFILELQPLVRLSLATLLPYLPVVLAAMPIDEILRIALDALT